MIRFLCFLIVLFMSITAHAAGSRAISLNQFISETIRNNPTVKGYIQQYAEAKGSEYAARGIDDVQLESLFSLAKRENPQIFGFESTEDKSIAYEIGASKIISHSGTRLRAKWSDGWTRSTYPPLPFPGFNPPNPVYSPSISVGLIQPLLKNILGLQDRLDLNVKRIQLEAADLTYQENIELFISEMTTLYLRWLNAYENSKTFERVYKKISEQEKLVRDEVEAKVADESDLYRALEQKAFYKAQWEGYLASYEATTREVAAMMHPLSPPRGIKPAGVKGTFINRLIGEGAGLNYLRESSRLRGILDLSMDAEEVVLRSNKNAKLPALDLVVNYRRHTQAQGFKNSHSSAFNNDDISGGLNLSVPINNRAARGTYRAQQARTKRVEYENERTMLDATSQLEAFYEKKYRLEKQVRAYEQQLVFGKKKLDEEYDQYTDGRLTLFQLLQDYTAHIANSVRLEASRFELAQTKLLIGELTDRNLFAFQDIIDGVLDESLTPPDFPQ
jgi:outer membrane protein TolC